MGNKKEKLSFFLVIIAIFLYLASCRSVPETVDTVIIRTDMNYEENFFDPATISYEHFVSTKEDVQEFIEMLNQLIRNRDYEAWKSHLSPGYLEAITSEENLRRLSGLPAMRMRRIVLRTSQDYFNHVVVPARANLRCDDIEFIGENRVRAFTIRTNRAGEEHREILYNLERVGNTWIIIN
ncbi:MAG: hypothetical protein FWC97_02365 [Treponema sp.]|nr:hypothetical protein [Treponema sp.]